MVAGSSTEAPAGLALVRLLAHGSLVTTFGLGGRAKPGVSGAAIDLILDGDRLVLSPRT